MAMLAHKTSMPLSVSGLGSSSSLSRDYSTHRTPLTATHNGSFASPTESEFSESQESLEPVSTWDERKVADWLKSIGCGAYTELFRANHVNGSNLIECDQMVLKEIGIKKIGDRVRLFVAIKTLRNKSMPNQKKRNRDSMAILDKQAASASSSVSSLKPAGQASHLRGQSTSQTKRFVPRAVDITSLDGYYGTANGSPVTDPDFRRTPRPGNSSPHGSVQREQQAGYFSNPSSARIATGWRPETPGEPPLSSIKTPSSRSVFGSDANVSKLPANTTWIRVIYNGAQTKVVDIKDCKNGEQIMLATLRKLGLPEAHVKNYYFYTVDDLCGDADCRRVSEIELSRLCVDLTRPERGRLILRKIHFGEPSPEEIEKARAIYREETADGLQSAAPATSNIRGVNNAFPLSPATFDPPRSSNVVPRAAPTIAQPNEFSPPRRTDSKRHTKPMKHFLGARPPSELISQELTTYFPDHKKDEIEKAVTLSQRRSMRLSRAINRLSVASTFSVASSMKDAPPMPSIADQWLTQLPTTNLKPSRPLSVSRFPGAWRDSVISTSLQPLQEESPTEPNRKSYVSFDSNSDNAAISVAEVNSNNTTFDDTPGSGANTDPTGSMNEKYRDAIANDGEGHDEDLEDFLLDESWDNAKWMQGALIGQGSFGSVFLALHAVTGELMAVKQVDMPQKAVGEVDKRKENMVTALRREIDLLRTLNHPHIVQYLGSNCKDDKFNIFLEYVPGGSVAGMLNTYGKLNEPLVRNLVRQILDGLSYLHSKDIIHRDIKGANVLVDNKGNIKISDFGISKRVEVTNLSQPSKHNNRTSLQGSVFWMAPEVVKQTSYTRKADIWSLGCLIVEMFTGEHPFPNCNQLQAIFQIGQMAKPATPEDISDEAKAFLNKTFEHDFEKRPSADELLQEDFLKKRVV